MGGMAHSLGTETPQITVPLRANASVQDVVVPVGMYRGGSVQAFKTGGRATISDMARHYGARR
jgi:aconitase A